MADGASALSTGLALIGLQLLSRLLTFSLNQALVRLTTPEALGLATIQFEVLLNTILFLSREGIRGALVRRAAVSDPSRPNDRRLFVNATFIPLVFGPAVAVVVTGLYVSTLDRATFSQPYFQTSLSLYVLATILELVAEPLFIRSLVENKTRLRVRIEGSAVVAKTLVTLGAVILKGERWGLLAYATGQAIYGVVLAVGFWWHYGVTDVSYDRALLPARSTNPSKKDLLDPKDVSLSWALTQQSLVKHFLSEGDKIIVGRICPIEDQGGYAVALNYGSLVARILFQPIEETARLHFSRTLGAPSRSGQAHKSKTADSKISSADFPGTPYVPAAGMLSSLLFLQLHLALIFVAFGPPYITTLLSLLLGRSSRYFSTSAPAVLRAYCFLLPFLGLNGVIEAFVQAVATEKQLGSMRRAMVLWSAVFVAATWVGTKAMIPSEVGMVAATGITMACRIVWGTAFIRRFFKEAQTQIPEQRVALQQATSLARFSPNRWTAAAFAIAAQVVRISAQRTGSKAGFEGLLAHLAVGAISGAICILVIALTERPRLRSFSGSLKAKR